ncbi:MAG: hypothetical protein WBW93_13910, partial [Steroidobacteraceae bacterium]
MSLNITDADVYAGIAQFIALCVPQGTTITQGQQNRIPMPSGPCVILTTLGAPERIGTNDDDTVPVVDAAGTITGYTAGVTADFVYHVQADFYSPQAESWAMSAELLWRDNIGINAMPDGMKPLYSEGRMQLPIVGGEDQWIQRWTMTLVLDYQPTWSQPT